MSSRGRGAPPDAKQDYATPQQCARSLLRALPKPEPGSLVVEPSAGRGLYLRELAAWVDHLNPIVAVDPYRWPSLDEACDSTGARRIVQRWERVMSDDLGVPPDLIVGNPPFSVFMRHIQHSLYHLRPGGILAFILRASCLHPSRDGATDRLPSPSVEVGLVQRPQFAAASGRAKGGDSADYSMFVWVKGADPPMWRKGKLDWRLDADPRADVYREVIRQIQINARTGRPTFGIEPLGLP